MLLKIIRKLFFTFVFGFLSSGLSYAQNLLLGEVNNSLNKYGVNFEFAYTGEIFSNLSGGLENKTVYLDNFDAIFDFDLDHIFGWKGATLNAYILGNNGGIPSEYSGVAQGTSNIAAHNTWKLYEFRLEQLLFNEKLSILAGLYDYNSEFDARESSALFINPSHGIGAEIASTGANGPSIFPTTSLALRIKYSFSDLINFKVAVFDGIPGNPDNPNGTHIILDKDDGLLYSGELTYNSANENLADGYFKYSLGFIYYTGKFDLILAENGNTEQDGNFGMYVSAEKFIYSENKGDEQGLSAFARIGFTDKNVNTIDGYLGAGLHYKGLIPGRDEDVFGIALGTVKNSENFITANNQLGMGQYLTDYELVYELTYSLMVKDYLYIQPDIQYGINPGISDIPSSLVLGTRLQILF